MNVTLIAAVVVGTLLVLAIGTMIASARARSREQRQRGRLSPVTRSTTEWAVPGSPGEPGGDPSAAGSRADGFLTDEDREQLRTLVRRGRTIQAIKVYRAITGVGLAEAKAAIDRLA